MADANQAKWGAIDMGVAPPGSDRSPPVMERTTTTAVSDRARWAWAHVALGSAGVVAVSVFYVLSPIAAVAPNLSADLTPARAATLTDSGFMRLAGATGVLTDLVAAVGALALAQTTSRQGSERQTVGFYWLSCAALVFTVVDALVGFGLRASAEAGLPTFAVVKPLFDVLTGAGAFAYGAGAVLVGWPSPDALSIGPRALTRLVLGVGVLLFLAGAASVWGFNAGLAVGFGLTVETVLFTVLAARNALSPTRARVL